ncbi:MAG: hypothetical protein A2600_06025 [Candidatus Lambdaproteobacteria bacterium RIFOXYD1_FULL_56_27]|uniref:Response regulatory domain-containing protein n=1 Tax=Candidatus Lambdaproteobacteria bacterium RIFOXYD2_FULL_56_26 TaxID=1817773 RepID=A0A1F6GM87_9PROT|nr:MAG: hypothetical protein A2557_10150 [Candidatus Lambdaproteobacteria bacterium RIFOXYD2_FULL_56_26]OGH01765.1 MAG: hypothetical protein A2426_14060 [Candidatus Lambdaproteobacteria bacterium RIFOXYC1_FULL_56_13]OGH07638.1 MAG: hypothetical protein A2600_06025 [Candidatus Lambdaproteobacteria bacterium RIFOXYD1_FULL_56_27]
MSQRPRFLIADDMEVNRGLMLHFVKAYGDCEFAVNGKEVVEHFLAAKAEGRPLDLILLDIMMPEMDGQEALTQIRTLEAQAGLSLKEEVKVVMVTAMGDWDNALAGFKKGAVEYLVKPIQANRVAKVMESMGFTKDETPPNP